MTDKPAIPATKAAASVKTPAKPAAPKAAPAKAAKPATSKPAAAKPAAVKPPVTPVATKVAAPPKPQTPPAAKKAAPAKAAAKPAKVATKPAKAEKVKKPKLVRDSYTMPENEFEQLAALKKRMLALGVAAKKSELLRAGLALLAALKDADVAVQLKKIPALKTGRPAK